LVIVGKKGWMWERELRLLPLAQRPRGPASSSPSRAAPRVIQLDYVPQSLLISLISGAKAVVFPSIYEGFGLPALEAMQLGTPVITSDTSSLPEVVGDAALLVNPYDPRAISQAIRRMDTDADLRARLAKAGPERAELFSPDRYQARLRDLYARLGAPLPNP